ncbi:MAG TPA: hypothetical protein VK463_14975 [Desulfomonilaceae bacterium]|nr:hypothetical protein [Desulfomonilaceae bacterium]
MSKPGDYDDLDSLIDQAVDTFFVEAPSTDELSMQPTTSVQKEPQSREKKDRTGTQPPSLDEAVDSLFVSSFSTPSVAAAITSGDPETDRAIDLAVDTLFIEEPDAPIPETTQIKVEDTTQDDAFEDYLSSKGMARDHDRKTAAKGKPPAPADTPVTEDISYDDAMAQEIERHLHTLFSESAAAPPPVAVPPAAKPPKPAARPTSAPVTAHSVSPLRKLQEAILTLEWEISKRSVTVLANEIRKVKMLHRDNVTVDFAALSMRVVLEYVVKRMSRAHPESIRFLLEVTDYLDRSMVALETDPLRAFHHILARYERYKSVVRKAEGLRDTRPAILGQLAIKDPAAFASIVERQGTTIIRAGQALATRLAQTKDPENLIRSFRFLVNRSVNYMLERTYKEGAQKRSSQTGSVRSKK